MKLAYSTVNFAEWCSITVIPVIPNQEALINPKSRSEANHETTFIKDSSIPTHQTV